MSSYHGWTHAPKEVGGTDPIFLPVVLFIKVSGDKSTDPVLVTGDAQFVFEVSEDMHLLNLVKVEGFVSTASSSGNPTVQIANITTGQDMLTTKLTIDSGEYTSKTAATAAVISGSHKQVSWGDLIRIDIDAAGTDTKGLGVMLTFGK